MKRILTSRFFLAALIAAATFIVFIPALHNEFVEWDDGGYVLENHFIRSFNAAFFRWAFFDFYKSNWHPLTWMSHALDYALWGTAPFGHHLTNVILHSMNSFLVVILTIGLMEVFRNTSRKNGASPSADERTTPLIAGGVAGLLFGLHPLHVESVVWVAERKDLLCALFFLLSIAAYMNYAGCAERSTVREKPLLPISQKGYLTSLVFFILALLSKPMAVSLPAVLLLLDWYPFKRIRSLKAFGASLFEKLPFIVLSLISSAITILAQEAGHSLAPLEAVPLSQRVLVAAKSLFAYLFKMAAPLNLVPFYPYEESISLFSVEYAVPVILVVVITFLCLRTAAKHKIWASVWVYYVITLLPVLGLVQAGSQSMADRYTYLPSLGPFVALGAFAAQAWKKAGALPRWSPFLRVASGAIAVVLFISLSLLTRAQTDIWKDSISLWSYVIEKEPGKVPRAYHNRANAFYKMGLPDRAVADYEKAITLNPSLYEAHANLGVLYGNAGLTDKAIRSFDMSLAINPSYPYGYCNRGITYAIIGEYGMALRDFNRAIELNANYARAYYSRGNLYLRTGRREFAAPDFEKACILGSQNGCRALRTAGT